MFTLTILKGNILSLTVITDGQLSIAMQHLTTSMKTFGAARDTFGAPVIVGMTAIIVDTRKLWV